MKKLLTKQWSFVWAGVAFGIAQLFYFVGTMWPSWTAGKTPSVKPMTVTTDLGKMFRGVEVWLSNTFGFADPQIYGSVKEIAGELVNSGGAFVPGMGWIIFGMLIGGWIVGKLEGDSRIWVKYSKKMLIVSFIGGVLFSYGTRLAGGCTLNHLLGGVPMMSIHSLVAIVFMTMGGLSAFFLMGKLGLAQNFKHQNTLSYSKAAYEKGDKSESVNYDPDYKPMKRPIFWIGLAFLVLFFGVAVYGGLFSPDFLGHAKGDKLVAFNKGIEHKGLSYVLITLFAGIIAGFGMAKSGFGTECALVSVEAGAMIKKDEEKFTKWGLPRITKTLFKGLLPIQGVTVAWIITLGGIYSSGGFLVTNMVLAEV
ncbi:MAG: YeeE/YedE family protein [Ignavibacteriae bacterium]|nr:YeeE/YedE family protein [Ignavibacteriota bacterium]